MRLVGSIQKIADIINRNESAIELAVNPWMGEARFLRLRMHVEDDDELRFIKGSIRQARVDQKRQSANLNQPYSCDVLRQLSPYLSPLRSIQAEVAIKTVETREEIELKYDRFSLPAETMNVRSKIDAIRINMANQSHDWPEDIRKEWVEQNLSREMFFAYLPGYPDPDPAAFRKSVEGFFHPFPADYWILDRALSTRDSFADVIKATRNATKSLMAVVVFYTDDADERFWLDSKFGGKRIDRTISHFRHQKPRGMIGTMWTRGDATRILKNTPIYLGSLPDQIQDWVNQK